MINQTITLDAIKRDIQLGKIPEALSACHQYLSTHQSDVSAWFILTDLYLRTKQFPQALNAVNTAEALAPNQPQIMISKIACLIHIGENNDALKIAIRLLSSQPTLLAKDWLKLGVHFHQLNTLENAHQCFVQTVVIEPNNSHYRFNLATSFRNIGDINQATVELTKTLALNPKDWDAYLARSLLKKVNNNDNHIAQLTGKITENKGDDAQSKLLFALAKEQEDCQQYQASFRSLAQANTLRNQFTQYDVDNDVEAINSIKAHFNKKTELNAFSASEITPIFIVGLPRTGTTLLERIISQHPSVKAAGELQDFSSCLTKAVLNSTTRPLTHKSDFIKQSAKIDFTKLGKSYLKSVSTHIGNKPIFIDKMPLNFLYVGLIQQALPQAKIIHLTRAPMAACYAIYKTSFGQAYPFSYDLNNLAKYYLAYRQLMKHWQTTNSTGLYEVNYEKLVTESAIEAQKTFQFLGLDWHDEYLELEQNRQASATASSSQVRGKIYQSSVELWRQYQEPLAPIKNQLLQAGIDPEVW